MSRASGLRVSSSLASGSTGIQIVTAPSPGITYGRSVLRLPDPTDDAPTRYKLEAAGPARGPPARV